MKLHYIPIYILLLIAGQSAFAQYETFSLDWNINAYDNLMYTNAAKESMPYRLLKPNNYNPAIKYPLVIMLHGLGEGVGQQCTTEHGINVCNLGWGGKMHLDSLNKYPAFYLFPQTTGGNWASGNYDAAINKPLRLTTEILTSIFNNYSVDLNRIYGHGLCAGGAGVWELAGRFPNLFAAISPQQNGGVASKAPLYVNTPVWGIFGELDSDPSLSGGRRVFDGIAANGRPLISTLNPYYLDQDWPNPNKTDGRPILTVISGGGHESWPHLYNSPSWLAWMFAQNKLNITIYGDKGIYIGESVKLEVAAGFDGYEWSNGATTRSITVTNPGDYRVRVKRKTAFFSGASNFTDWSPVVTITSKGVKDITKPSTPTGLISTGKTATSAMLSWNPSTDNQGVAFYQILLANKVIDTTSATTYNAINLTPGTSNAFKVAAVDLQGNISAQSNQVSVATNKTAFGLKYSYYEGFWDALPNFDAMTAKKTGYVTNCTLDPKMRVDYFGFKYEGFIDIPTAGAYRFYTSSDDGSKLYIDNVQIVNNDGLHGTQENRGDVTLTKGRHAIKVIFFESGGDEVLEVRFRGPGISKQLIPDTSLYFQNVVDATAPSNPLALLSTGKTSTTVDLSWNASTDNNVVAGYKIYVNGVYSAFSKTNSTTITNLNPSTAYTFYVVAQDANKNVSGSSNSINVTTNVMINGVQYSYYDGSFSSIPNFVALTPSRTGYITNFSLSPRLADDNFAFKYTSYLQINSPGTYNFYTASDDGSKLYIDGVLVVNNDGFHSYQEASGTIGLTVGRHAIEVDFFEGSGDQTLDVSYEGPGISKQAIPDDKLFLSNIAPKMAAKPALVANNADNLKEEVNTSPNLSAYPNPFDNQLSLSVNTGNEGLLKIYNSLGEVIMQRNVEAGEHHIDLSNYSKGFYYLKIYSQDGVEVQTLRVVKN